MPATSPTSRHSRCTKRQAPCTPSSVQITSRSGGESDSMNQRATSAPYSPMMSSGSTVLRFDFDIFSIEPISTSSPVAVSVARRPLRAGLDLDLGRRRPAAVRLLVGLVHHHALGEHAGERLVEADVAGHLHGAGEEARIEQVQDRVLDAADVLVDRQQAIDHAARGRRVLVPRIGEAREVPRRVDERVHRVGLARRLAAALRAGDVLPGRMMVERVARLVERHVLGQRDRQVLVRHRHHVALRAMDHRDRAAPVALARDAPVAQAEIHLALADRRVAARLAFQPPRDLFLRLLDRHAVEEARIDHAAVAVIGHVGDDEGLRIDVRRAHHRRVAEPVFVDEVEVALVVRRAAEDRAGAVFHQDEVRDVDRQRPRRIERMDRPDAGVEAELLLRIDDFLRGAVALASRR